MHTAGAESNEAEELEAKAAEGLKEARGAIEGYAKEHPRIAVGVAVGIGFVLGGGMTPRLLFGLGAFVARRYAREFARAQLGSVTRGIFGGDEGVPRSEKSRVKASRTSSDE